MQSFCLAFLQQLMKLLICPSLTVPLSRPFLAEILSFCLLSSSLNFSASLTMRSISSLERRPLSLVMVILFCLPVLLSHADTFRIPLASMSKVTSICGTPLGAGGMAVRSNLPRRWLSLVMALSPSYTWMVTAGWSSEYVVKVWVCLVGIVVFLLIKLVITPPAVSMPRERGATSRRRRSETASDLSPTRIAACTAAPYATASSGLIDLFNSFPLNRSEHSSSNLALVMLV